MTTGKTDDSSTDGPVIRKGTASGQQIRFRNVETSDANFILALRTDRKKGRHLSPTSPDTSEQKRYLESYESSTDQAYFIIETMDGKPVGTVRIYDPKGRSFCWGSWILADDAPKSSAVESTLMIYRYGLALGFESSHFDVRKANEKVWRYHERCGARRISETDLDYFYEMNGAAIEKLFQRYRSRLPNGIDVAFRG